MPKWLRKLIELFIGRKDDKPASVPAPEPALTPEPEQKPDPEPEPENEPVNKGGDGLYKPEGNLWLLPSRNSTNGRPMRAPDLGRAGEFSDPAGERLLKWFRLANQAGHSSNAPTDGRPIIDHANLYHGDRLKMRDAKATYDGTWFLAWDKYGQRLFAKQIINRGVRQE